MTNQAWTYGVEDPGTCPETLFDWWHVRFSTASSTPISFQMGFIDVSTIASLFLFETNELFIDGSILMRARKKRRAPLYTGPVWPRSLPHFLASGVWPHWWYHTNQGVSPVSFMRGMASDPAAKISEKSLKWLFSPNHIFDIYCILAYLDLCPHNIPSYM